MDWGWGINIGSRDVVNKVIVVVLGREDRDLNFGSGIEERDKGWIWEIFKGIDIV